MQQVQKKYQFAVIATDVVIFTVQNNELKVLLIKMKKAPFTDSWAAPGGLVRPEESIDEGARRILQEKAGIKNVYLEQLHTFGEVNRDPFGRVVSVGYFALIPSEGLDIKTTQEYQDIAWFPATKLPALAYDHKEIISYAISRLQERIQQTNIVHCLMSKEFTLTELQKIYEIILRRKLDKRNYRKKIASLNLVQGVHRKKRGVANRPAELYQFVNRKLQSVRIL